MKNDANSERAEEQWFWLDTVLHKMKNNRETVSFNYIQTYRAIQF